VVLTHRTVLLAKQVRRIAYFNDGMGHVLGPDKRRLDHQIIIDMANPGREFRCNTDSFSFRLGIDGSPEIDDPVVSNDVEQRRPIFCHDIADPRAQRIEPQTPRPRSAAKLVARSACVEPSTGTKIDLNITHHTIRRCCQKSWRHMRYGSCERSISCGRNYRDRQCPGLRPDRDGIAWPTRLWAFNPWQPSQRSCDAKHNSRLDLSLRDLFGSSTQI
jgi:hypothetical protein